MRILPRLALACCLLSGSAACAWAQDGVAEQNMAQALVEHYVRCLSADQNAPQGMPAIKKYKTNDDIVRTDIESALEKLGSPAVSPLLKELQSIWNHLKSRRQDAVANPKMEFEKLKRIAKLFGRFAPFFASAGPKNPVAENVRATLLDIATFRGEPTWDGETDARVAAIEVLGKIYSQKGAYLIVERPEVFAKEKNAMDGAKQFRNQARDLKAKFVAPVKKGEEGKQVAKQLIDLPDPAIIAGILLDARNFQRKTQEVGYRRLFLYMSELERVAKQKSLAERIELDLEELETNLRIAASGYDPQKKDKECLCGPFIESMKRDGWMKANRNAFDLCEEMEVLVEKLIPAWEREKNAVEEVLKTFSQILNNEKSAKCADDLCQLKVRLAIAEATGRIYAGGD